MPGKIHRFDTYDLRKWQPHDVKTFVDIGANVGTVSIMARILFPEARIIAFEPCREVFEKLLFFRPWGVEVFNYALGDGKPLAFQRHSTHSGMHKFWSKDEPGFEKLMKYAPDTYYSRSKTLPDIIKSHKVEPPYILKIDCEGGERFLLKDPECKDIVRNSLQTNMELHRMAGSLDEWLAWYRDIDTHDLLVGNWDNDRKVFAYHLVEDKLPVGKWSLEVQLLRKKKPMKHI
jgi:FkbM family methyltransferase